MYSESLVTRSRRGRNQFRVERENLRSLSLVGARPLGSRLVFEKAVCLFLAFNVLSLYLAGTPFSQDWLQAVSLVGVVFFALLSVAPRLRVEFRLGAADVFLILFAVYSAVNCAFLGSLSSRSLLYFSRLFALCMLVFLLARMRVNWFKVVLISIVACSLVHACATVLFWIQPDLYNAFYGAFLNGRVIKGGAYRSALTTHYSMNGMYLAQGLMASVGLFAYCRRSDLRFAWASRTLAAIVIVMLLALVLSGKRAHLVFAVAAIMVFWAIADAKHPGRAIALGFAGVVVLALALALAVAFIGTDAFGRFALLADDTTVGGRIKYYFECARMFFSSPIGGMGWGSFASSGLNTNAHNVFLQLLGEEGLAGFVLFTGTVLAFLLETGHGLEIEQRTGGMGGGFPRAALVLAPAFLFQIFFILYCLTGNPLYDSVEFTPYFLALASVAWWRVNCG